MVIYAVLFILIVLSLGVYIANNSANKQLIAYPYGQADSEKAEALRIAFKDTIINSSVQKAGKYTAEVAVGSTFEDSGFINVDGKFALVRIQTGEAFAPQAHSVLADLASGREMEARYQYNILRLPVFVLLPHDAYWYRSMTVAPGQGRVSIYMEFKPQHRWIYPMIVDGENFEKLRDGQPFEPLSYIDHPTGEARTYDGTTPVSASWKTNVTLSGQGAPAEFYVVLKNTDHASDMWIRLKIAQE